MSTPFGVDTYPLLRLPGVDGVAERLRTFGETLATGIAAGSIFQKYENEYKTKIFLKAFRRQPDYLFLVFIEHTSSF